MNRANFPNRVNERRKVALSNLRASKFFEKGNRTKEDWQARKEAEIAVLEKRIVNG